MIVPNPKPGAYTIEVQAHNIPIATQPYALAVGGAITEIAQAPSPHQVYVPAMMRLSTSGQSGEEGALK